MLKVIEQAVVSIIELVQFCNLGCLIKIMKTNSSELGLHYKPLSLLVMVTTSENPMISELRYQIWDFLMFISAQGITA